MAEESYRYDRLNLVFQESQLFKDFPLRTKADGAIEVFWSDEEWHPPPEIIALLNQESGRWLRDYKERACRIKAIRVERAVELYHHVVTLTLQPCIYQFYELTNCDLHKRMSWNDEQSESIAERFTEDQLSPGHSKCPLANVAAVHMVVLAEKGKKLLMGLRSKTTKMFPSLWEISFGEILHGPGWKKESDMISNEPDFLNAVLRGARQELKLSLDPNSVFFTGIALETQTLAPKVVGYCITDKTEDEVRSNWKRSTDTHPALAIEFIPFTFKELYPVLLSEDLTPCSRLAVALAMEDLLSQQDERPQAKKAVEERLLNICHEVNIKQSVFQEATSRKSQRRAGSRSQLKWAAWSNHPDYKYKGSTIDRHTFETLDSIRSEFDIFILDRGEVRKGNHVGEVLIKGTPAYRNIGVQGRPAKKASYVGAVLQHLVGAKLAEGRKGSYLTATQYRVIVFALKNPGATILEYAAGCFGSSEDKVVGLREKTKKQFYEETSDYRAHIANVSRLLKSRLNIVLRGAGEGKYHFRDPETNNPIHDSKPLNTCVLERIELD